MPDGFFTYVVFSLRQDVPDDELVASIFSEASRDSAPCSPPPWALSGRVSVEVSPGSAKRTVGVHLSKQLLCQGKTKQLIFVTGNKPHVFVFITPLKVRHLLMDLPLSHRGHTEGSVSAQLRLPECCAYDVIGGSHGSARPVCTFPV